MNIIGDRLKAIDLTLTIIMFSCIFNGCGIASSLVSIDRKLGMIESHMNEEKDTSNETKEDYTTEVDKTKTEAGESR